MATVVVVRPGLHVEPEGHSKRQRLGDHWPGDEVVLGGICARHARPRQRVVPGEPQTQHVSTTERDPPAIRQRELVESQLRRMKVRLTNQRVVAAGVLRRDDVTLMTQVMTFHVAMTTTHWAPHLHVNMQRIVL